MPLRQRDTFTCVQCGRTGSRDFIGLSGDWAADSPNFEVICANRHACEKRQKRLDKYSSNRQGEKAAC